MNFQVRWLLACLVAASFGAGFAAPLYMYRFAVSDRTCQGYPTSVLEYSDTCNVSPLNSSVYHLWGCDIFGIPTQQVCSSSSCGSGSCSEPVTNTHCRRSADGVTMFQIGCQNLAEPYRSGEVKLNYYGAADAGASCAASEFEFTATIKRCDYVANNTWMHARCSGSNVVVNTCSDDICSENCVAQTFPAGTCVTVNGYSVTATCATPTPVDNTPASSLQSCDNATCPAGEICYPGSLLCIRDCRPKATHTSFAQYPPGVGVFRFSLRECGGSGLPILNTAAVAEKKQLVVRERGASVSKTETTWMLKNDGIPGDSVTVILVDLSSSVKSRFDNLTYSVNQFVEAVISDSLPQQVSVLFFDGSANTTSILAFTNDLASLRGANNALYSHAVADISTNLHGAIVSGVRALESKFTELGPSYSYNLVVFSDGVDEAYRVSDLRALDAVTYPISREMRLQVSSVIVGDASSSPFLSALGPVYSFLDSPNITTIIRLASSSRHEDSFYRLAYCTAKRAGVWTSSLSISPPGTGFFFSSEQLLMYMRLNATGFEACDASDLQAALDDDAMKFRRYDPPKVDNTIISASTKIVGSVVLALIGAVLALLV